MCWVVALSVLIANPAVSRTLDELERDVRHALSSRGTADELATVLDRYVDFEQLAAYAFEPRWQNLAPIQRKRIARLLRDIVTLQSRTRVSRPTEFSVAVRRQQRAGDFVAVLGTLNPDAPDPTALALTFLERGGRWRVVDLAVDGRSVARGYRDELYDILNRNGVDVLIRRLNARKRSLSEGATAGKTK